MKTNTEIPTPITDEVLRKNACSEQTPEEDYSILATTCADLERQLAESREENARLQKSLSNASAIYDAVCEQRDRLAEALEDILNDATDSPLYKIRAANEALAAVKGGVK